jgi:drug/metabolite transporter, DME family
MGALAIGDLGDRGLALGTSGLLQAAIAVPALRPAAPALRQHTPLVVIGALAVAICPLAFYSSMATAGVAVGSVVPHALCAGTPRRPSPLGRWWMAAAGLGTLGSVLRIGLLIIAIVLVILAAAPTNTAQLTIDSTF